MKSKLIGCVVAMLFLFGALPSKASPLPLQDFGTYTLDPNTGLQWLDVSKTFGRSMSNVEANFTNPSDPVYGYHYATVADIAQLVVDAGIYITLTCNNGCGNAPALLNLEQLLGGYPSTYTVNGLPYVGYRLWGITGTPFTLYPSSYCDTHPYCVWYSTFDYAPPYLYQEYIGLEYGEYSNDLVVSIS